jgi:hypothetical protein
MVREVDKTKRLLYQSQIELLKSCVDDLNELLAGPDA